MQAATTINSWHGYAPQDADDNLAGADGRHAGLDGGRKRIGVERVVRRELASGQNALEGGFHQGWASVSAE
jgi:hypothetical protein